MRSFRLWTLPLLTACLMAVVPSGRSDEGTDAAPLTNKNVDTIVFQTLRDVINKGADLYNPPNSDYAGCWRLYEGALMAVKPFLSHRPNLQAAINTGLTSAYNESSIAARAFVLRKVIDEVRSTVNPNPKTATAPAPRTVPDATTLWDRLGGEANVRKVIDDFIITAAPDPKVNFFRDGKYNLDGAGVTKLKQQLVDFISAVSGGPFKYTGKDMKEAHRGMGITDAEFDALAGHLKDALVKNGAKPEDVSIVLTAVNGTRQDIVEKKPEASKPAGAPKLDTPKPADSAATLWDRLGGEKNVARVIDDLFKTAGADPKVNFFRDPSFRPTPEEMAALKKKVIDQISSLTGGPYKYTGKDMKEAHKGMQITDDEFNAFAGHLQKALEKNGAKPEDVKIVMTVMEGYRKDIVEKSPEKK